MTAAACMITTGVDGHRYSDIEAETSLRLRGDDAADGTFHTTARKLMKEWNRSAYWVMKFLAQMEAEGTIRRQILPDNGGTLITMTSKHAIGAVQANNVFHLGGENTDHISHFIYNLPPVLSARQADRLSLVYKCIIYGEPGYEWADVEHLEIIEQALFPIQMQQAA